MLKKFLCIVSFVLLPLLSVAQDADQEYELRSNEKEGWIINKKGEKIEGVLRLMGSEDSPWVNQQKVRFIAKSDIDPSKKRQKLKVLDVDDLKGYAAYDGDVLREFELIKYTNVRESSRGGSGLGGSIKSIKNLSNSNHIAEIMIKGPVTVYRLYGLPTAVAIGNKQVQEMEDDLKRLRSTPSILVSKNGGKIEELNSSDMKKLTEDCEFVRAKMLNKKYVSYDPDKEEKKRSKMGALLKSEMELDGEKIQKMALEVLTDYNANCGK
ncbi:hypothetical protein SAMN05421741_14112 [Paenimyroides ummariense]|uniref:GLPGLI family protein n=1 Tax=Paenimyroides ummariense TaxID=913024 RepID=A0A1I5GGL5_9FLAO|nr:hypothetical protein [Paenimyroides ummariense]SFO35050.1 hypothetical protein SAMN05421741_14112 [Paenimyroides ummariense]